MTPTPAAVEGSDDDRRAAFENVFQELDARITAFVALSQDQDVTEEKGAGAVSTGGLGSDVSEGDSGARFTAEPFGA